MIISCESCATRFKVPDERVTAKGTKVRCSKCTHVFVVFPEGATTPAPPPKKKKTLQFRAGQVAEAAVQDEKLQRRVTETFDVPASKDPFSSENLPQTAADPFSGSGPAVSAPASGSKSTQQFLTPQNDPFSGGAETKAPDPFGGNDPFGAAATPKPADPFVGPGAASSDPFGGAPDPFAPGPAAAPSPPASPAPDPFSSTPPPASAPAAAASPFGSAPDPFGGAPDPFASAGAPPSSPPAAADPFGGLPASPPGGSADPFGAPPTAAAEPFGAKSGGDPFGPSGPDNEGNSPPGADPFGPPVQPGPNDPFGAGAGVDPMHRPPAMTDPPSAAPAFGDDPFGQGGGALDGLFDDADPGPNPVGPPPVPEGAKPITDPFSEDLGPGFDEIGAPDDDDDDPPRQNFQAETRVYSVPNELREASVPQADAAPVPQNTSSMPLPPSVWRQRAGLVASTAWQIAILALFMFIALVWARGGTLDDVLSGNIVGVITEGATASVSDESLRIVDVAVQRRTVKASPALVVVSGEIQNTTGEPIRGVAVKVEFTSGDDGEIIAGPFYGWAGESLSPIDVESATTLATLAELAAKPVATTIDPQGATTFAVLAPGIPLGAVAKVSASQRSVALPLPTSLPVPIEIVPAAEKPAERATKKPPR